MLCAEGYAVLLVSVFGVIGSLKKNPSVLDDQIQRKVVNQSRADAVRPAGRRTASAMKMSTVQPFWMLKILWQREISPVVLTHLQRYPCDQILEPHASAKIATRHLLFTSRGKQILPRTGGTNFHAHLISNSSRRLLTVSW